MEPKVRVVDGPIATEPGGTAVAAGIGWYPAVSYDSKVYIPSLANGTQPALFRAHVGSREAMVAVAKGLVVRDSAIFRGLA